MVMVGGIWMKRSRMVVADCETLAAGSGGKCLRAAGGDRSAAFFDLAGAGDDAQRNRSSEDLQVVIVDLILQSLLAELVET